MTGFAIFFVGFAFIKILKIDYDGLSLHENLCATFLISTMNPNVEDPKPKDQSRRFNFQSRFFFKLFHLGFPFTDHHKNNRFD